MAGKVRIKGKITHQETISYNSKKDGKPKKFYSISVARDDGVVRKVATFKPQDKLKDKYVEIIAEHTEKDGFDNYKLLEIKEQEGRLDEDGVDEEESISDDSEEVVEEDGGKNPTPTKKTSIKEDVNTESGKEMDPDVHIAIRENEDKRHVRSKCLSYAKDLCVGGKIGKDKMVETAKEMYLYVWGE